MRVHSNYFCVLFSLMLGLIGEACHQTYPGIVPRHVRNSKANIFDGTTPSVGDIEGVYLSSQNDTLILYPALEVRPDSEFSPAAIGSGLLISSDSSSTWNREAVSYHYYYRPDWDSTPGTSGLMRFDTYVSHWLQEEYSVSFVGPEKRLVIKRWISSRWPWYTVRKDSSYFTWIHPLR